VRLSRFVDARPEEERRLLWSFLCFFFLLTAYYLLRPIRDAMGLDRSVEKLPWLFTATFLTICVTVPIYSLVAARFPRHRVLAVAYRFLALTWVLFFAGLVLGAGKWLGYVFYVWVSVVNLFFISIFWSFMADVWDPRQARRLFAAIAAGGSVGAILGPGLTTLLVTEIGPPPLLLLAAGLFEASRWCAGRLGSAGTPPIGGNPLAGILHVFRSKFLFGIAAQIFCFALTSTILYLQQASYVAQAASKVDVRAALFARLDLAINIGTLILQLFIVGRFVRWARLSGALVVLPLGTAIGFLVLGVIPSIGILVAVQALRRALHFAVDRPAREMLWTQMPPEDKYKAKVFTDTFVYRGADGIGAWTHAGFAAIASGLAGTSLLAAPIALVWLGVALAVGRAAERGIRHEAKS